MEKNHPSCTRWALDPVTNVYKAIYRGPRTPFLTDRGPPCIESKSSTIFRCQNLLFEGMLSQLPLVCHIAWVTRDGMNMVTSVWTLLFLLNKYETYIFLSYLQTIIYVIIHTFKHWRSLASTASTTFAPWCCFFNPAGGQGTRMEKSSKPSGSSTIKVSPKSFDRLEEMVGLVRP